MRALKLFDPAETWLAKHFLGPEVTIYKNNIEFVRLELKKRVFEDVRRLIKSANLKPPFDPKEIAKFRGVLDVIEDPDLLSREACLIPTDRGFIIKLNPRVPETKKRCNCAHEIGHTYFYNLDTNPPSKSYSSKRYWVEEGYVSEIAREIVVPEPDLFNFVQRRNLHLSVQALIELSSNFKVSYGVLGERLLHDAHSINKEFWDGNVWEGIIAVSVSPKDGKACISKKPKIEIYRSPKYKRRLMDVTSKKLEKAFEGRTDVPEVIEKIMRLILEKFIDTESNIHKQNFSKGRSEFCIEVGKVDEKCVLSVLYENE